MVLILIFAIPFISYFLLNALIDGVCDFFESQREKRKERRGDKPSLKEKIKNNWKGNIKPKIEYGFQIILSIIGGIIVIALIGTFLFFSCSDFFQSSSNGYDEDYEFFDDAHRPDHF